MPSQTPRKQPRQQSALLPPWAGRALGEVAPEEDGAGDAHDEAEVQQRLHPRLLLQGREAGLRRARGPCRTVHAAQPEQGADRPGPPRGRRACKEPRSSERAPRAPHAAGHRARATPVSSGLGVRAAGARETLAPGRAPCCQAPPVPEASETGVGWTLSAAGSPGRRGTAAPVRVPELHVLPPLPNAPG